jgi:hypothetical protein
LEILDPATRIELPGGKAFELTGDASIKTPEPKKWPEAAMLDGTTVRADQFKIADACGKVTCVRDLSRGEANIFNEVTGCRVQLTWDIKPLAHLWIWQETRTSEGPWRKAGEMLGIEPTSVPHHLGLAEAIKRNEAIWLEPGQTLEYQIAARIYS